MHIYFSGIGGAGIGPLSQVAFEAGYQVSGSDKQDSQYLHYLRKHGVTDVHVGQTYDAIAATHERTPIDWFVYTSALSIEHTDAPELQFCRDHNIKTTKRDDLINHILAEKELKLLAVAGTHGKTTTTAMLIWLLKQIGQPLAYSVGAKLSFGDMGTYQAGSEYFIYEADEFDRNFLAFHPHMSLITGIDWDHPDIYPTREEYEQAFREFIDQSKQVIAWQSDVMRLELTPQERIDIINDHDKTLSTLRLPGEVNRRDAWQVIQAVHRLTHMPVLALIEHMNAFPGLSRRFEQLVPGLYSDYAHTPPKIRGALQLAHELAGQNVVVVYEGLHNTRQHFIRDELRDLFDDTKHLYIVPSYLAREDPSLQLLQPEDISGLLNKPTQSRTTPSVLDDTLKQRIEAHLTAGDLVLCLTAGGGNSLDEWLRQQFSAA